MAIIFGGGSGGSSGGGRLDGSDVSSIEIGPPDDRLGLDGRPDPDPLDGLEDGPGAPGGPRSPGSPLSPGGPWNPPDCNTAIRSLLLILFSEAMFVMLISLVLSSRILVVGLSSVI